MTASSTFRVYTHRRRKREGRAVFTVELPWQELRDALGAA